MAPAVMATTVPAVNALTMNWYWKSAATSENRFHVSVGVVSLTARKRPASAMWVHRLLFETGDEDAPQPVGEHLDGGGVDRGERRRGDDLGRRPHRRLAVRDVEDLIDERQQGVHVVCDQQHGQPTL